MILLSILFYVFLLVQFFITLLRESYLFYIYNVANFVPVFMSKNIHNFLTIYLFCSALQKPCQPFIHFCIKLHEKTLDKLKNSWSWRFFACFRLIFQYKNPWKHWNFNIYTWFAYFYTGKLLYNYMVKNWHILTNGYFSMFTSIFSAKIRRFKHIKKLYLNCIF